MKKVSQSFQPEFAQFADFVGISKIERATESAFLFFRNGVISGNTLNFICFRNLDSVTSTALNHILPYQAVFQ